MDQNYSNGGQAGQGNGGYQGFSYGGDYTGFGGAAPQNMGATGQDPAAGAQAPMPVAPVYGQPMQPAQPMPAYPAQNQNYSAPVYPQAAYGQPMPSAPVYGQPASQPVYPQAYGAPAAYPAQTPMAPMPQGGYDPYVQAAGQGAYDPAAQGMGMNGGMNPAGGMDPNAGGAATGGAATDDNFDPTTQPGYDPNYKFGGQTQGFSTTIKLLPHSLSFDENYFLQLLAGSISLSRDEKKKILEAIPRLRQEQVDELIRIFEEERSKFEELSAKHGPQLKKLEAQHAADWKDIEIEAQAATKQAEENAKAEEIRKQLGI